MRLFAARNPTVLTQSQIEAFGIPSHPPHYQSARFRRWEGHCRANNATALRAELLEYLRGRDSVKTVADLGEGWSGLVGAFLFRGADIDADATYRILKEFRADALFGGKERVAGTARMAVADTLGALAHLKHLGHPSNLDYQTVLRIMALTERAVTLGMQLPEPEVVRHFVRPVLLHPCFHQLDPCRPTGADESFAFLREEGRAASAKPGCVDDGGCGCKVNNDCVNQSRCCARPVPYVVDLMIVRDHTACYQAGDLSHITNVLAGETLTSTVRRLEKTEEVVETELLTSRYEERDLQTEDRTAVKREIAETLAEDLALDAGVTANATWGKEAIGKYTLSTTTNFSYASSKDTTNKLTRDYARNVVARAVEKVEEKLTTTTKTTRLREVEETNTHEFASSAANVSGQYLYVNKCSRAQVYNYGRAAVVDLRLPEPAATFIRLLEGKFEMTEPRPPAKPDLTSGQITPENYQALVTQYGLTGVPAPPPLHLAVQVTLEGEAGDPQGEKNKSGSHTFQFPVTIPPDYAGVSMHVNNIRLNYNQGGGVSISATLGSSSVYHEDGGSHVFSASLPGIQGSHTVVVHTWDVTNFTWILTIQCNLTPEARARWQEEVFAAILEVLKAAQEEYEKELEKYLEARAAFEDEEEARRAEAYNANGFDLRLIERRELKRMAITYVSCQFFDSFDAMKHRVRPCGYSEMDVAEAEREGRVVQFFEQAFNWNLMTYIFYPYFWGRKCTWPDKLKVASRDPIFRAFLSAGSARVMVPIRDGFLDVVQYFLATGEIWGGDAAPPLPGAPHYVSMAQEIKEQLQHFYADRPGTAGVVNGSSVVTVSGTDWWWTYADPAAVPPVSAGVNAVNVAADLDREISLDTVLYRIVDIQPDPGGPSPTSWLVTLDRPYEGATAQALKWSTGAVFVGAPWEFVTPTTLTFLRDPSPCLPCYPLAECQEPQ